jgi:hypothetical protein
MESADAGHIGDMEEAQQIAVSLQKQRIIECPPLFMSGRVAAR